MMNTVEAVKSEDDINLIEDLLKKYHGQLYADLWKIGLNVNLRISDLLKTEYADLDLVKREYILKESKTGKSKVIRLNKTVINIIKRRKKDNADDVYLFQVHSNRSNNKPPSREHVARILKSIGSMRQLNIKLGTHSMRKTKGYIMHKSGVAIELICKALNHSNPSVTMAYIGITQDEVLQTYDDYEL